MNKSLIKIVGAIVVLLFVGLVTYLLIERGNNMPATDDKTGTEFPIGGGDSDSDTENPNIPTPKNPIIDASETVSLGGGSYVIAEGSTTVPPSYRIGYYEPDDSFTVTLYDAPFGETRLKAEEKLIEILGLTKNEACALRVTVAIPNEESATLSGKNLGLSFCGGATPLK
jgi:hypothetical protein